MPAWRRAAALIGVLSTSTIALAIASWAGCSIYDSSLLLSAPDASDGSAVDVIEAGAPEAAGPETGPGPCPEVFPPPKPAVDDPSDAGDDIGFVVALHTIDVGLGDAGVIGLGYDLDKVYTGCDGGPESCKAAVTGAMHPDTAGGRDDSAGELLQALASFDPSQFNASTISQRLQDGTYSVLLQILHYNGQPNDTQISVGLYGSNGVDGDAGAAWNGQDAWRIDDTFVVNPDASTVLPTKFDATAYVSEGVLVMHVNFPLSLGASSSGSFTINLSGGLITGKIVPDGNGAYGLKDGQIAGRWNVSDLLAAVQAVSLGGQSICPGSNYYSLVKNQACQYADIMTDYTRDNTGATCDALSLGIGFTADPALIGSVVPTPVKMTLCEAGPPDTCAGQ